MKEVGFKPGVKERQSYRCTEWWMVVMSTIALLLNVSYIPSSSRDVRKFLM